MGVPSIEPKLSVSMRVVAMMRAAANPPGHYAP